MLVCVCVCVGILITDVIILPTQQYYDDDDGGGGGSDKVGILVLHIRVRACVRARSPCCHGYHYSYSTKEGVRGEVLGCGKGGREFKGVYTHTQKMTIIEKKGREKARVGTWLHSISFTLTLSRLHRAYF